jgi:hypothetical protein
MERGAPYLLAGSLYFLDCVKDEEDGLWKIKNWRLNIVWREGGWEAITGN